MDRYEEFFIDPTPSGGGGANVDLSRISDIKICFEHFNASRN